MQKATQYNAMVTVHVTHWSTKQHCPSATSWDGSGTNSFQYRRSLRKNKIVFREHNWDVQCSVLFQPVESAGPGAAGEPAQVPPLLPLLPRQTTDPWPWL